MTDRKDTMRQLLTCALLATLAACGGGGGNGNGNPGPEVRAVPFTDGYGTLNSYSLGLIGGQGSFPSEGWYPGCLDCARVVTVAQDRESAERALQVPHPHAALDRVDFAASSVIVFDRVVAGTTYSFLITAVEERASSLTVRSTICVRKDPVQANGYIFGFIVVPKTTKPAAFARSETTSKPPVYDGLKTLGEC